MRPLFSLGPTFPETGTPLPNWPADEWKANIGCPECGLVFVYRERSGSLGQGRFHSDTVCACVEFRCSQTGCGTLIKFHTTLPDRSRKSFDGLLDKLHRGFFQGRCANGHGLLPVPREKYEIREVFQAVLGA